MRTPGDGGMVFSEISYREFLFFNVPVEIVKEGLKKCLSLYCEERLCIKNIRRAETLISKELISPELRLQSF